MPPVPVYVKGGTWSNIEDQILKAAIEKYGTHQWSKIASLLQKKTARQCELRWTEFLNPSLNFTPFSKEEDAKLLELVRRLPNQWRTISDVMGRTPQVCVERYNVLLEGTDSDVKLGSSLDLEAGDIDLHAESRPARPDPMELESMDKEMLAEARARLLNTQGKKATRKIRERMLEESKRVAQLQKRRELKQAGIDSKIRAPRKKFSTQIDYNADIVYEREPESGPYDTTLEDERSARAVRAFEKSVERKGLHENEEGNKTKRKRRHEDVSTIVGQTSVLTDDYKKPKLSLPPQHDNERMGPERAAIKRSKRSILKLFSRLPQPKNDFELELDEEIGGAEGSDGPDDDEAETDAHRTAVDISSGANVDSSMNAEDEPSLSTFSRLRANLPLPEQIKTPSNPVEREYNELLASAMNPTTTQTENLLFESIKRKLQQSLPDETPGEVYLDQAAKLIDAAQHPAGPGVEQIRELQSRLQGLQNTVDEVTFFKTKNQEISDTIFSELLPKVAELRHSYFVKYKKYQNEYYACQVRRNKIQEHLYEAGAEKPV
ncbi:LAFA_0B04478g1_1 [Lachancea sp. 'fantastica']|nr:LAFA_0B04478g1_1 [Lachancea sp. 'fantastica']